jgi:hypothetical protein
MAQHTVKLKVAHAIDVGNVDVEFEVRSGGPLLGRVQVSKGGIDWTPRNGQKPRKASWQEFADWMMSEG